jgi:NAD(P)-dependent dehydrogenase (short-subunit alcohol dehydrogenase family)
MNTETTHNTVPSVAITSAGSGLGREIAIGFADKGDRVFGTARNPQEINEVQQRRRTAHAARPGHRLERRTRTAPPDRGRRMKATARRSR